jgi:hypothetical protein
MGCLTEEVSTTINPNKKLKLKKMFMLYTATLCSRKASFNEVFKSVDALR